MWKLIAVSGVTMLIVGSAPLRAEEMPWCVELDVFTKNCSFASRDECVAVAANAAGPATGASRCIRNPSYQGPAAGAAKVKAPGQAARKPQ